MTSKDYIKAIDQAGTKIEKNKLIEALRRTNERSLSLLLDPSTGYAVVKVKI